MANLPAETQEIEEVKCYYAPIGQFQQNPFYELNIWAGEYARVLQFDREGEMIIVDGGLYRGSCGAPYINNDGTGVLWQCT